MAENLVSPSVDLLDFRQVVGSVDMMVGYMVEVLAWILAGSSVELLALRMAVLLVLIKDIQ